MKQKGAYKAANIKNWIDDKRTKYFMRYDGKEGKGENYTIYQKNVKKFNLRMEIKETNTDVN